MHPHTKLSPMPAKRLKPPRFSPSRTGRAGLFAAVAMSLSGCGTDLGSGSRCEFRDPGRLRAQGDIIAMMNNKPETGFPVKMAVVCLNSVRGRDKLAAQENERLVRMLSSRPGISEVLAANEILMPPDAGVFGFRTMAAQMQADTVLVYALYSEDRARGASSVLNLVSLGLAPITRIEASAQVDAALFDVRTGYLFKLMETRVEGQTRADWWSAQDAGQEQRTKLEGQALVRFNDELGQAWAEVFRKYGGTAKTPQKP